jgi:hypothetical protein
MLSCRYYNRFCSITLNYRESKLPTKTQNLRPLSCASCLTPLSHWSMESCSRSRHEVYQRDAL